MKTDIHHFKSIYKGCNKCHMSYRLLVSTFVSSWHSTRVSENVSWSKVGLNKFLWQCYYTVMTSYACLLRHLSEVAFLVIRFVWKPFWWLMFHVMRMWLWHPRSPLSYKVNCHDIVVITYVSPGCDIARTVCQQYDMLFDLFYTKID